MRFLLACFLIVGTLGVAQAQVATDIPPPVARAQSVFVERAKVHGSSLEGNLEGDSADRDVFIFLPPSYKRQPTRRYPVIYALHGYSIGAQQWTDEIHVPQTIEGAFALGAREMIVVLPDSKTLHNGSLYSNSPTTGNFEDFIAYDLVAYIDAHYRTLKNRRSRGLAGHSMGGYGTVRIGMKHSEVFGSLYIMSPCCLSTRHFGPADLESGIVLEGATQPSDSERLPFNLRAQLASAAAWSPNPTHPPLYLDLPIENGVLRQDVLQKWTANSPLAMLDQYIYALRAYHGISMDVGDQDSLREDAGKLHGALDTYGIDNRFSIYPGTHTSGVADRFQNHLMPFMSQSLCFHSSCL